LKITVKTSGEGKGLVAGSKTVQISLDKHGSYLGMEKGRFVVKDRENNVKRFSADLKKLREKYSKLLNTDRLTILVV
jgi:glutamate/tyrosine decarboxylase-like PLP-dependent enzyme